MTTRLLVPANLQVLGDLPPAMKAGQAIDMNGLMQAAHDALELTRSAVGRAQAITDQNAFVRLWKSKEFQRDVIQAVQGIGELARINLALSAVCSDLAAANLRHAEQQNRTQHVIAGHLQTIEQLVRAGAGGPTAAGNGHPLADSLADQLRQASEALNALAEQHGSLVEQLARLEATTSRLADREVELTASTARVRDDMDVLERRSANEFAELRLELRAESANQRKHLQRLREQVQQHHDEGLDNVQRAYKRGTAYADTRLRQLDRQMRVRLRWIVAVLLVCQVAGCLGLAYRMNAF